MPSSSILILLYTVLGVANAVPWAVAEKTATYKADEWSPKPTNTPLEPRGLFKRSSVDVDVCGWIGGNLAQPVGCSSGSSCIHDTLVTKVGCCPTSSAGASAIPCTDGLYTTCIDSNSAGYSPNSIRVNNGVLSCPPSSSCYKIDYPDSYIQFGCGPSTADITAATTFAGQATDLKLQVVFTGVNFDPAITIQNPSDFGAVTVFPTSTSSSTESTTESTASNFAGKGSLTSSTTESTSSASPTSKGKSNTGAIIGGTVGALVVIIGTSVLAFFLIRRRENKRESSVSRGVSSPKRPSKSQFESIPNPTPSPQPIIPPSIHSSSPPPQEYVSPMSVTNNLGYAPVFQSPYHRPTTPIEPVEAPTPDLLPRNFRSPSPAGSPFEPPQSQILPETYDPTRARNPSRSPDPQSRVPYLPHPSNSPRPAPASPLPPINTNPTAAPPMNDLPPLDIMDDVQTPATARASLANWHLALTGDRRTYAPSDSENPLTTKLDTHDPMPTMPALYADLSKDLGISTSPPADNYLSRSNNSIEKSGAGSGGNSNGTRRNFSRKGRAEKGKTETETSDYSTNTQVNTPPQPDPEPPVLSNNIRSSGWSPAGLRTRNSPSPSSVNRFRSNSNQGQGEEVRIAYNPGLGVRMPVQQGFGQGIGVGGLSARPSIGGRPLSPGREPPPRRKSPGPVPPVVVDPDAVEGGWL